MNWKYFCGAGLLVGAALVKSGVPVFAIALGIGLAAMANYMRQRSEPAPRATGAAKVTKNFVTRTVKP